MEKQTAIFFSFGCLLSSVFLSTVAGGCPGDGSQRLERGKLQLFAFGDSYADTGNLPSSFSKSWKFPYGITFPGKPSGRFSDGRVLTDYIASYLGIKSPLPYELKNFNKDSIQYGMNFAHGGTGVFKTMVDQPNMSAQIDFFQQLVDKMVYTCQDISSSIALVSLAGNDYSTYKTKNDSLEGLTEFTRSVIDQLVTNVRRINGFGIKKIAITGVPPVGCLPQITSLTSYESCNADMNDFSQSHNTLLKQNIWALNEEAAAPVFIYLDLYTAFTSTLRGNLKDKLKPCCVGDCGLVDKNGKKEYGVCENPNHSLFWDSIHPSDAGWQVVYMALINTSLPSLLL